MACKTSFELYHNFPKLAEESGFTFNTHRPRVHIEWHKIRLVDIESLIRERKFVLIEQHLNDILDCVLESEFDVRILDEGVLKIFRLAQLAVEYQQFCRHYLDRSVYVLREEVSTLAQELDSTKRLLREREEEIRKLKRKSRHSFRNPLPYGNDNIATMILKTLNNKSDLFPTLPSTDTFQHNKCTYCDKVFLNQLYLESHVSRRHANVTEIPQRDVDKNQLERNTEENNKLTNEITELRSKLEEMEKNIDNFRNTNTPEVKVNDNNTTLTKEMKDAEVSVNGEGYILDKIEEWKKEEHEKYNREINLLRTQIFSMIDSYKVKDNQTLAKDDSGIMAQLNATIKQQEEEILALRKELTISKPNSGVEEIEQRQKLETQMAYWVKRAELQSNEYKLLLQKLDDAVKEAEKSCAQVEAEKLRVTQLQELLQQKNLKSKSYNNTTNDHKEVEPPYKQTVTVEQTTLKVSPKSNLIRDRSISLQRLQRKAQELLNIENTSASDNSASSDEKIMNTEKIVPGKERGDKNLKFSPDLKEHRNKKSAKRNVRNTDANHDMNKKSRNTNLVNRKNKVNLREGLQSVKENGGMIPASPIKVIRAKITEEVNNRLVTLGVDPLKCRLPQNIFIRQRMQLQEQQAIKFKKNPGSEQILHSLLTRIDSNAIKLKKDTGQTDVEYISPTKNSKAFSLSSVISNVKTKALSLVKVNDPNKNAHKSYDTVAKKAMLLLRTPESSAHSSPKIQDRNKTSIKHTELEKTNITDLKSIPKNGNITENSQVNVTSNESGSESVISDEYQIKNLDRASTSIKNLIQSPTRRPLEKPNTNYAIKQDENNVVTAVKPNILTEFKNNISIRNQIENNDQSSNDIESLVEHNPRRAFSEENILKQTKGVLKNASSTSSLNKKKVIFDMDAIQMKSVSASSPSQSVTEKSDNNEKYGLGMIKLDNEEWDISSIENEPVQKNIVMSRTSPKIAELKQTIESQLTRRSNAMSTALVGGVDVLTGPLLNNPAVGGSNTSLGSSILDDTDSTPAQNQIAFVKTRSFIEKDDSEIDISEFVTDDLQERNIIKTK